MKTLNYNPGLIPNSPPPKENEIVTIKIDGLPPYKDRSFSIRNKRHKIHKRFITLRETAIKEMKGRAWFNGPIRMDITINCPIDKRERPIYIYAGGIADSLDGSHGQTFTYLPIVYEDDGQICEGSMKFIDDPNLSYTIKIQFLPNTIE